MPRKRRNEARNETKPDTLPSPVKEQYQKIQLALLARSLQKVNLPILIPATREDLVKLQVSLMELNFNRTITASDFSLGNQAVRNLITLIAPPQAPQMQTLVQTGPSLETIIAGFVNKLPAPLRKQILEYTAEQAKLEDINGMP